MLRTVAVSTIYRLLFILDSKEMLVLPQEGKKKGAITVCLIIIYSTTNKKYMTSARFLRDWLLRTLVWNSDIFNLIGRAGHHILYFRVKKLLYKKKVSKRLS